MAEHMDDLLPGYAAGTLPDEDQTLVAAHLAHCPRCGEALTEWRRVAQAVRADVTERAAAPPPLTPVLSIIAARPPNGHGDVSDAGADDSVPTPDASEPVRRNGKRGHRTGLLLLLLLLLPLALLTLWRGGGAAQRFSWRPPPPRGMAAQIESPESAQWPDRQVSTVVARQAQPERQAAVPPAAPARPVRAMSTDAPVGKATPEPSVALAPAPAVNGAPEANAAEPPVAAASGDDESPNVAAPSDPSGEAPAPQSAQITGRVVGPDGQGRAEIRLVAGALEVRGGAAIDTYSEPDGSYRLVVPAGQWTVHVEAPAYQLAWAGDRPSPTNAQILALAPGDHTAAIDFRLLPNPAQRISGRVLAADGTPVGRALIVAVPLPGEAGSSPAPEPIAATFTAADGSYALYLEAGNYLLGATEDWRHPPAHWWRSAPDPRHADPVTVSRDAAAPTVDITLETPPSGAERTP
jgi:hypothetical protein